MGARQGGRGVTKISKPQQGEGRIFSRDFLPMAPPWPGLGQLTCPQKRHSREMKIYSGGPGWGLGAGGGVPKAQGQIRPLLSLAAP